MQLFAQLSQDVSNGFAGWSSFGIVGAVLSWLLLKHLPSVFEAQKEERVAFKEALNKVVAHCESEMKELTVAHAKEFESIHKRLDVLVK